MIKAPQMILVGSTGRNAGKTTLAARLIEQLNHFFPVTALKITTIEHEGRLCVRGGAGCGACSLGTARFILTEETEAHAPPSKDTAQLAGAGAEQVFWLRSLRTALTEAFCAFQEKLRHPTLIVCESNALREIVQPALFIMLENTAAPVKPSAQRVRALTDAVPQTAWDNREITRLINAANPAAHEPAAAFLARLRLILKE